MEPSGVSRRSALKYLGLLAASAAGREFLAAWLPSESVAAAGPNGLVNLQGMSHSRDDVEQTTHYLPRFFKPKAFKTVETLTEMMLPTDEEPGAKEARVADYIEFVGFF